MPEIGFRPVVIELDCRNIPLPSDTTTGISTIIIDSTIMLKNTTNTLEKF